MCQIFRTDCGAEIKGAICPFRFSNRPGIAVDSSDAQVLGRARLGIDFQSPGCSRDTCSASEVQDLGISLVSRIQSPDDLPHQQEVERGEVGGKSRPLPGSLERTSLFDAVSPLHIKRR